MTLDVVRPCGGARAVVIGLALAGVLASSHAAARWSSRAFRDYDWTEGTQLYVNKLAHAYPLWLHDHPGRTCPAYLGELVEEPCYHAVDAWGHPFAFWCTARGLLVVSAGEDGVFGTDDDVRSDP